MCRFLARYTTFHSDSFANSLPLHPKITADLGTSTSGRQRKNTSPRMQSVSATVVWKTTIFCLRVSRDDAELSKCGARSKSQDTGAMTTKTGTSSRLTWRITKSVWSPSMMNASKWQSQSVCPKKKYRSLKPRGLLTTIGISTICRHSEIF